MNRIICIAYVTLFIFLMYSCSNNGDIDPSTRNGNNAITEQSKNDFIRINLGGKRIDVELSANPIPQKEQNRTWKEIDTSLEFSIGGIYDTLFFGPTRIRTDESGNIYVLDMGGASVKKFNSKGKYIRKFGNRGKGPGEFISAFAFDVSDDETIAVLDPDQNKIEVFKRDLAQLVKCRYQPLGVALVNKNDVVILQMMDPIMQSYLRKYNVLNNTVTDYENIINVTGLEDKIMGMLPFLQGRIFEYDNGCLVYAPIYMNFFITYDQNGKISGIFKTIDDLDLPEVNRKEYSVVDFRLPEEYRSYMDCFINSSKLYLVSSKASREVKKRIVDVYDLSSGSYLFSFEIIQKYLIAIHITSDRLYLLNNEAELLVYNYTI